eukprot:6469910-Amphidinium_carterae.2
MYLPDPHLVLNAAILVNCPVAKRCTGSGDAFECFPQLLDCPCSELAESHDKMILTILVPTGRCEAKTPRV